VETLDYIQEKLDRLYTELADLERYLILHASSVPTESDHVWNDLRDLAADVSASWNGPGAVEEIRAQREK